MNAVEYNVEPMGIENWTARMRTLKACARSRGLKLDELTRAEAYRVKAELSHLSFELFVRGTCVG